MAWWGWIVIGTLLFCVELFAIDAQFFLIFIGAGAIVVGLTELLGLHLPAWGQWLMFALLSIGSMILFRRKLYDKLRGGVVPVSDSVVGGRIVLEQLLQPGESCRVEYRGTKWTALNTGDKPIPAGASALIEAIDGLTLRVNLIDNRV
jgi:inner membrane protein